MTLTQRFVHACEKFGHRTAITDDTGEWSYARCAAAAQGMAALVRGSTTRPNVGILLPTCKEFVASLFGILLAGKTPVPLNVFLSGEQLGYIVKDAGLDLILTTGFFKELVTGRGAKPVYLEELPQAAPSSQPAPPVLGKPDDLFVILYTSGTTANPKGVMLTHANVISNMEGVIGAFGFTDKDVILGVLPLFHSFALTTSLALPMYIGAKVVYLRRFSAPKVVELIQAHKITAVLAIPSMYRVLVRVSGIEKFDLRSLRLCVAGGEPLTQDVVEAFGKHFPIPLLEGYGLTETSPVVSVNEPHRFRHGTAGRPIRDVEVKIVDDEGRALAAHCDGEVWVRGPNIMKGYLNLPKETAHAITPEGWFRTGDIGRLDPDGFLKITGRKKDLIISSGENIAPGEIEEVLSKHPAVLEVAVVGAPDKARGEVVKAFIALAEGKTATEDELRDFCRGKLAPFKIPKQFEFRPSLPRGLTGKILKRSLK
ncbi:MAG: long-chain fatty acid--CoA ligase [Planctomycetes bacterium]|nr:long-chain fatty acid--CoA ligase [Planctomycetota bacterium]